MIWAHKTEPPEPHPVDPHYAANGVPEYWVCHACRTPLLLDGGKPPLTVPPIKVKPTPEPPMSSQP